MKRFLLLAATFLLATGASPEPSPLPPSARLDAIARDYVRLTLEAGEREPGYVDAYYGPPEWQAEAKAATREVATLRRAALDLSAQLKAMESSALSPDERRRQAMLVAQLKAADTRLAMNSGAKLGFVDEATALFGIRPPLAPLSAYDPVLARVEALVPGPGPLWQRVDMLQNRHVVPPDRIEAVLRAATAECRRRTAAHIALPEQERFDLELVRGKSWSGYNWYKGGAHSLIQVNTDLPFRIDRAIDLGCHEGYPGHHVLNMLLERELVRKKGWIEYSIYPLYSPQSFIAEGSANAGIDLAFPDGQRTAFEAATLYPIAGLDPRRAAAHGQLIRLLHELAGARLQIAARYLDGKIGRAEALDLLQRYQLVGRDRAEQSLKFIEQYRSYTINYGLGQDLVEADLARAGPSAASRWKRMEAILSEPTLASDLRR